MKSVYRYKVYDINSDTEKMSANYGTENFIKNIEGAKILFETEIQVQDHQIDGDGKLLD